MSSRSMATHGVPNRNRTSQAKRAARKRARQVEVEVEVEVSAPTTLEATPGGSNVEGAQPPSSDEVSVGPSSDAATAPPPQRSSSEAGIEESVIEDVAASAGLETRPPLQLPMHIDRAHGLEQVPTFFSIVVRVRISIECLKGPSAPFLGPARLQAHG